MTNESLPNDFITIPGSPYRAELMDGPAEGEVRHPVADAESPRSHLSVKLNDGTVASYYLVGAHSSGAYRAFTFKWDGQLPQSAEQSAT